MDHHRGRPQRYHVPVAERVLSRKGRGWLCAAPSSRMLTTARKTAPAVDFKRTLKPIRSHAGNLRSFRPRCCGSRRHVGEPSHSEGRSGERSEAREPVPPLRQVIAAQNPFRARLPLAVAVSLGCMLAALRHKAGGCVGYHVGIVAALLPGLFALFHQLRGGFLDTPAIKADRRHGPFEIGVAAVRAGAVPVERRTV